MHPHRQDIVDGRSRTCHGHVQRRLPDAEIYWLVERLSPPISQMHLAVTTVLTMAWRKWRSPLFQRATARRWMSCCGATRSASTCVVLDSQGPIKIALWARQAGVPIVTTNPVRASGLRHDCPEAVRRRREVLPRRAHESGIDPSKRGTARSSLHAAAFGGRVSRTCRSREHQAVRRSRRNVAVACSMKPLTLT